MNVLLIGSGGREHAIATGIAASPQCKKLFIAPGNAGTSQCGQNTALDTTDASLVIRFCQENQVQLVVIGPEQPLVDGLADALDQAKIPVVGPGALGAQLEGSKDFSKKFMQKYGIPTAGYRSFSADQMEEACSWIRDQKLPIVVKASGLAAGKGVLICENYQDAESGLRSMLSGEAFGHAGATVVIEEFLSGIELSVFILTDGKSYLTLPEAKDYKRIGEGDTGLNTGGMGAVSPVPFADPDFMEQVRIRITDPTLTGLRAEGIPFKGFIFIGLMKVGDEPYVIEYNVRMGDPETEVVFPRIKSDIFQLFNSAANGSLSGYQLEVDARHCSTIMLVSGGYPGSYEKGKPIEGLEKVASSLVFHAGTKVGEKGEVLTNGGRVLAVTSLGENLTEALSKSYENAKKISWEGIYYRKDIGKDVL